MVHTGVMAAKEKSLPQSVTPPAKVASRVRSMAKCRRLSANRMLVELVEEGIEARKATDPREVERLGEELGQMIFGK